MLADLEVEVVAAGADGTEVDRSRWGRGEVSQLALQALEPLAMRSGAWRSSS